MVQSILLCLGSVDPYRKEIQCILTPRVAIYEEGEKIMARMGIASREMIFHPHLFSRVANEAEKADMRLR